ncbi:MAG: protein kinase [Akkermansiaceae bacterium]|nr:protein kinase [Akkermansiaceae bacterium]
MTPPSFTAPSLEAMNALLPAFDFKALIASNELSAVYMAGQRSLEREVAIKILAPHVSESADFRKSFETTARMMARLNHPNLIGLYDSGLVDGMLYFVMEFVPGKSLARSAKGQQVDVTQALSLIQGIASGIAHAHDHGISHGDLNPSNVLLNQKAEPKIGNFGFTHPQQTAAEGAASPYTAPEAVHQVPTKPGDIFALGAILYELLTGHPHRTGAAAPSTLSKCGEAVDAVWRKATDVDPAKRFPDAKSLLAALSGGSRGPGTAGIGQVAKLKPAAPPISDKLAKVPAAPAKADSPDSPTPPPPAIKVGFNWKLVRNLIIIGGLLYAISLAWENYQRTKAGRERAHADEVIKSQAEKEKKRLEDLKRAEERRKNSISGIPGETTKPLTPPPSTESPEASLARLRNDLYSGERSEMPLGSIAQGENSYFLVKEPMSWPEASWFAEKHGGFIAIPNVAADLTWLLAKAAPDEIGIWIGAARSSRNDWKLADGEVWKPKKEPTGIGRYLALDKNGLLRAEGLKRKLPFVIQWRKDGKNPAQLETLLARTGESLKTNTASFPPGTAALRTRHYLYVARPTLWGDALKFAQSSGGILAVPSDNYELTDISQTVLDAEAPDGVWIGGFRLLGDWEWMTGEPWKPVKWAGGNSNDATKRRVVFRPGAGLDHLDPENMASGFIIEWSNDAKGGSAAGNPESSDTTGTAGIPELDTLTKRAKDLLLVADRKRAEQLATNAKTFTWDLDTWVKGLPRSENLTWSPHVSMLKASVSKNRVPAAVPLSSGIKLSSNMAKIAENCAAKQDRIDAEFVTEADRIRTFYTGKVREMLAQAVQGGKGANAKILGEALDTAGNTADWVRSLGLEARPENPKPGSTSSKSPSSNNDENDGDSGIGNTPRPGDSLIE